MTPRQFWGGYEAPDFLTLIIVTNGTCSLVYWDELQTAFFKPAKS
jgi:hypothetical protein